MSAVNALSFRQSEDNTNKKLFFSFLLVFLIAISGCRSDSSFDAPILMNEADSTLQHTLEGVANDVISDVQQDNLKNLTQQTDKPNTFTQTDLHMQLSPFKKTDKLTFETAKLISHGTKAILRIHFIGEGSISYRANINFVHEGSSWKVESIVGPAVPAKMPMSNANSAASTN